MERKRDREGKIDFSTVRLVVEGFSVVYRSQPLTAFGEEQILHLYTREISRHGGLLIFGTKEALDTDAMPITRAT